MIIKNVTCENDHSETAAATKTLDKCLVVSHAYKNCALLPSGQNNF